MPPRARQRTLHRALSQAATGRPTQSLAVYTAHALAQTRAATVRYRIHHPPSDPTDESPPPFHDLFPKQRLSDTTSAVDLLHYPTGVLRHSETTAGSTITAHDYQPSVPLLAIAGSRSSNPYLSLIRLDTTPHRTITCNLLPHVHTVAASRCGTAAVAGHARTLSLVQTRAAAAVTVRTADQPDASATTCAHFCRSPARAPSRALYTGSARGAVVRWDVRVAGASAAVWRAAAAPRRQVLHVRAAAPAHEVYVRADVADARALAAWDVRVGDAQGPVKSFVGVRGCDFYATSRFDVEEGASGGLLAAGIAQQYGMAFSVGVWLWDCSRGGEPLETIGMRNNVRPLGVRFVGWDGESRGGPGLVVEGERVLKVHQLQLRRAPER